MILFMMLANLKKRHVCGRILWFIDEKFTWLFSFRQIHAYQSIFVASMELPPKQTERY